MTERIRCFVAIPVGDDLRARLGHALVRWRERPDLAGLRWSDPAGLHLTLAFVGDVSVERVRRLAATLAEVAAAADGVRPLPTGGLGAFPSAERARVAWYGVRDEGDHLARLALAVRTALGAMDAGPFRAHITLARSARRPVDLRGWLRDSTPPDALLSVERIELMRSVLGRGPARYETLASAPLRLEPAGV